MSNRGFIFSSGLLLATFLIIISVVALIAIKSKSQSNAPESYQAASITYEECLKESGRKLVSSYPKKCVATDGKVFIENITDPVDITNWEVFKTGLGFSVKCPPGWKCGKSPNGYISIDPNQYYAIPTFHIYVISADNFQSSELRHPSYKNPVIWFNDLKTKKELAIKVIPETIQSFPGTDGLSYPAYYRYEMSNIKEFETDYNQVGLIVPLKQSGTDTFIRIDDKNLLYMPESDLFSNPITKAIVKSIQPE